MTSTMSVVSKSTVRTMAPLMVSQPARKARAETAYDDEVCEYFECGGGNGQAAGMPGRKGGRGDSHGPPGDSRTPRRYLP